MSSIDEKKEKIIAEIEKELAKDPVQLNFSSPRIRSARPFVVIGNGADPGTDSSDIEEETEEKWEKRDSPYPQMIPPEETREEEEDEEEELSPKQLAKLEKARAKEEKRNEKAYNKMRIDIQKRGFGTGVLKKLDDPADIYDLSDEDIRQIEVAGIINSDGYYTFTYPEDFNDIDKDKLPKKAILIFAGFAVAVILLTVILVNNLISIF